ncbi:MAG: hypothetical protein J0M17_26725, partial [Planctomycetes bacterium]|nr:hypothetical protein [Planctomycetota bacterium]
PAYDRAGNMTTIPKPAAPQSAFAATYDAWNRLTALSDGGAYAYDALNRRTKQVAAAVTRHYYYSADWQVLEERLGTAPNAAPAERQFLFGQRYIDDLVLRDRSPTNDGTLGERLYAVQDANWNVTAVVNTSGGVQERYRYTAYGEPSFLNPNFTTRALGGAYNWETLYVGYRWDAGTGIYPVRFRYLNPLLGMWITKDPMEPASESNFYRYASDNPANSVDPLGLEEICDARTEWNWPYGPTAEITYDEQGNELLDLRPVFPDLKPFDDQLIPFEPEPAPPEESGYDWGLYFHYANPFKHFDYVHPDDTVVHWGKRAAQVTTAVAAAAASVVAAAETVYLGGSRILLEGRLVGGQLGSGGILQLRPEGKPPLMRFDYHPFKPGGPSVPHIDSPPLKWHHWPWQ